MNCLVKARLLISCGTAFYAIIYIKDPVYNDVDEVNEDPGQAEYATVIPKSQRLNAQNRNMGTEVRKLFLVYGRSQPNFVFIFDSEILTFFYFSSNF